jgi:hypothetical protein
MKRNDWWKKVARAILPGPLVELLLDDSSFTLGGR